jgi:hypothetical protein
LLVSLASRLGRIEVHGSGIEQLVVDERPSEERIIYVSPGAHVVRAVVSGTRMEQTPELRPGDVVSMVFGAQAPLSPREPLRSQQPDRPTPETLANEPPSRRGGVSPWFVAGGGILTGVAVAATIASGLSTLSALDAFNASPTRTNVLLGVSIGLGVMTTSTAIWFTDWHAAAHGDVRLGLSVTQVEAEWRF